MPQTMPKGFVIVLCLILIAPVAALAQANPVSMGAIGTPITPSDLGNWSFMPMISAAEAVQDAQAQGFRHVGRMRQDDYGDWIGQCGKGELIVFPDGRAYPL
jgi:hypothetical protein